ncbi:MAG: superoxide dismutase [Candidatus Absconditicoccaceae bacterium]
MIELKQLPYEMNSLEPYIDLRTVEFHYTKHHQGYVDKLNGLIKGTEFENMNLEEIILKSNGAIFNNAAQIWNHTFYRDGLIQGGTVPSGNILSKIEEKFGSFDIFKENLTNSAVGNFGSGRTWLVKNKIGDIEIINTSNADCPITKGLIPLLTIDVREHAYYLNYQNRRIEYVNNLWNLINRDRVNELLG